MEVGAIPTGGTLKRCCICKHDLDVTEFNKNSGRKDGLNSLCRVCSNKRSKLYYSENKVKHKSVVRARAKRHVNSARDYVLKILNSNSCTDCGTKDIRVFEFDHVRGDKHMDVSKLIGGGYSIKTIQKEIDKCDIVCCNCHRIRTFTRAGGNYKFDLESYIGE